VQRNVGITKATPLIRLGPTPLYNSSPIEIDSSVLLTKSSVKSSATALASLHFFFNIDEK
jgi:hypothetical protein